MDIKIRARLSAYSKIDSNISSNLPSPGTGSVGAIVGVGSDGTYTLFHNVDESNVDTLFTTTTQPSLVTKDTIDTLFVVEDKEPSVPKDQIDTLFTNEEGDTISSVSFSAIDTLFKK